MPKFGDYVKLIREKRGWTQQQLAAAMDGSVPNVQRMERMDAPMIQGRTYAALSRAFGMTTEEFDKAWRGNLPPPEQRAHPTHVHLGRAIPIINKVFASRFIDRTNLDYAAGLADGYTYAPQITDSRAFAWVVEGECMEPDYHAGDVVICSPAATFVEGWDYFVQMSPDHDSVNTFKRVFLDGEYFVLKAVNPAFAREQMRVLRSEVHSMAKAVFVQRPAGPRKGNRERPG